MQKLMIVASTQSDNDYIDNKIVEYNSRQVPFTQEEPFVTVGYVVKDDHGTVVGGITALIYCWKIVCINVLWIDERYRGQGYGTLLLTKVEDDARARGVSLIHLDTFDFQAKDFYLRHGYEIFGQLDDCPPGHARFFMKKKLM